MKTYGMLLILIIAVASLSSCESRTPTDIFPNPRSSQIYPSDLPEDGYNTVEAVLLWNAGQKQPVTII